MLLPGDAPSDADPTRRTPGLGGWLLAAPMVVWLGLFVVLPSLLLVGIGFCTRDALGRIVFDFSLHNYLRAFEPIYLRIVAFSLWYAFVATALCLAIGYPVAWCIGTAHRRVRGTLLLLVVIPFWISFLVRTYAWISILANQGLLNATLLAAGLLARPLDLMYTPFAVVLGLIYNYLPFMILPIYASVEKLDRALIEAAHDLGAGRLRVFAEVIVPLTWPGIVAGCVLVFVPSIAMFAITTLMGGGAVPMIGNVIQNQFGAARNPPFGAALGTGLLSLGALWLLALLRRQGVSGTGKTKAATG